jgi:hypothetical protein
MASRCIYVVCGIGGDGLWHPVVQVYTHIHIYIYTYIYCICALHLCLTAARRQDMEPCDVGEDLWDKNMVLQAELAKTKQDLAINKLITS